ncbi:MAG: glycoside hydrolase family protein [Janthinobacterium lividum]
MGSETYGCGPHPRLLASTIGPHEDKARRDITVPLQPNQFDALVSFLYNPGHGWPAVRDAVNKGDYQAAALVMKKQVKSAGSHYAWTTAVPLPIDVPALPKPPMPRDPKP